jgi:hypothetical protein
VEAEREMNAKTPRRQGRKDEKEPMGFVFSLPSSLGVLASWLSFLSCRKPGL